MGAVRYVIVVTPFTGDLEERPTGSVARSRGYGEARSPAPNPHGHPERAARVAGRYSAPGRGGRYAVFRAPDLAIEVTVAGSVTDLRRALAGVDVSTKSIAFQERDGMTEQALGPVRTASTASVHPTPAWAEAASRSCCPRSGWSWCCSSRRGAGRRIRR